jgi:hypothetical protein
MHHPQPQMHHPHLVLKHFERDAFSREVGAYRISLPLPKRVLCSSPEFLQAQERLSILDGNPVVAKHFFSARHPADTGILVEVAVKSKSLCDTKPFHDNKARAIDKAKEMIPIGAKYV